MRLDAALTETYRMNCSDATVLTVSFVTTRNGIG
jgi:hypothetical protein